MAQAGFGGEVLDSDDEDAGGGAGGEVAARLKTRADFGSEDEWAKYKEAQAHM